MMKYPVVVCTAEESRFLLFGVSSDVWKEGDHEWSAWGVIIFPSKLMESILYVICILFVLLLERRKQGPWIGMTPNCNCISSPPFSLQSFFITCLIAPLSCRWCVASVCLPDDVFPTVGANCQSTHVISRKEFLTSPLSGGLTILEWHAFLTNTLVFLSLPSHNQTWTLGRNSRIAFIWFNFCFSRFLHHSCLNSPSLNGKNSWWWMSQLSSSHSSFVDWLVNHFLQVKRVKRCKSLEMTTYPLRNCLPENERDKEPLFPSQTLYSTQHLRLNPFF